MLSSITIKRNNHWLYHCEASRKNEMLTQLIANHADKSILIAVSHQEKPSFEEHENVTVMSDDEITNVNVQQFDLIIHADLPQKAEDYMKRLACAKELSLGLLLAEESQRLYQIETLLGRTVMQKHLEGFEPVKIVKEEAPKRTEWNSKDKAQRESKPYQQKKTFDKPRDPNKPRQRNHHKDGTPRTEEERTEYQVKRAKFGNKTKSYQDKKGSDKKGSDERGGKKPFSDKKKYDNTKKPFDKKRDFDNTKNDRNSDNKFVEPKRKPRTFSINSSKKKNDDK